MTARRRPWFRPNWPGWHYPEPSREHPSWAWDRRRACPTCGAPPRARCATKGGEPCSNHTDRSRERGARIEQWTTDGRGFVQVDVQADETVVVAYAVLANMLSDLGYHRHERNQP